MLKKCISLFIGLYGIGASAGVFSAGQQIVSPRLGNCYIIAASPNSLTVEAKSSTHNQMSIRLIRGNEIDQCTLKVGAVKPATSVVPKNREDVAEISSEPNIAQ